MDERAASLLARALSPARLRHGHGQLGPPAPKGSPRGQVGPPAPQGSSRGPSGLLAPLRTLLDGRSAAKVLVVGGLDDALLVGLFDGLEAAWQAVRLVGAEWPLERLEISIAGAGPDQELPIRRAVNGFWGWDPELRWEMARRHDRLPLSWTCRFARDLAPAAADGFDVSIGGSSDEVDSEPESDRVPLVIPEPDRDAARFFLERFTGQADFEPGQWEAVSRILAGRSALLLGKVTDAEPVCELVSVLLPGAVLSVSATHIDNEAEGDLADFDTLLDPGTRSLALPAWRLQDQSFLQRFRQALRTVAGGLALVVVAGAESASVWSADFKPAFTRLPGALQEIAARPGTPVLALADTSDNRVVADVEEIFRTLPASPGRAQEVAPAAGSILLELLASEPDADALAPVRREFPGWRIEAELARREIGQLAKAIAAGGFATVPVRRVLSLDADAGRADRFRGFLSRLHALGFIAGFGESADDLVVKHPIVLTWSVGAYLAPIAERALAKAKSRSFETGDLAALGPVDLCECLVQHVLGRNALEARRTALFFEQYVCPSLHRDGSIAVPKRPHPDEEMDFALEPLLYRLAQLEIVREYFLNLEGSGIGENSEPAGGVWKIAFRKPDPAVIRELLDRRAESLQAPGSAGVSPASRAIASGSRQDAGAPRRPESTSKVGGVVDALEEWLRIDYDVLLPTRVAAIRSVRDSLSTSPALDVPPVSAPARAPDPGDHQGHDPQPVGSSRPLSSLKADSSLNADSLLEAAFNGDIAQFDPTPIVAHFAVRLELGILRDLAAGQVQSNPDILAAHALLMLANWELGDAREASRALSKALDRAMTSELATQPATATEAMLALCPPELRAIELGMRREALSQLLGPRRVRRLLHDTYAAAGRSHDADAELLAELRPVSAGWRTADDDLVPLATMLSELESGYGPLDDYGENAEVSAPMPANGRATDRSATSLT